MVRNRTLCGLTAAGILTGSLAGIVPTALTQAAGPSCPKLGATQLTQSQSFIPAGGNRVVVCTGKVRSFDGARLHVDISLPTVTYTPPGSTKPAKSPLVMFLSGWS